MRTTVITGGSSGIGAAICAQMLALGHRVVNVDIAPPGREPAGDYHWLRADLCDVHGAREVAAAIAREWEVSGLVNNAGIARTGELEQVHDEDFASSVELHLHSAIALAQAFVPAMKTQRFGRIVNMASRAVLGKKGRTVYGGTKAALVGMTRTWALELGPHGITVNAIAPGPIVTELFKRSNSSEQARKLVETTAVGRGGTPEDVAAAAAFFLGAESGFVTGQVLHVCGGASIGGAPW